MINLDTGEEISYDFDASDLIKALEEKNQAVVNKRPDSDPNDTKNKRVLMQSVTFDKFAIDNQKIIGWMVDLDTGNEIPVDIDVKLFIVPFVLFLLMSFAPTHKIKTSLLPSVAISFPEVSKISLVRAPGLENPEIIYS